MFEFQLDKRSATRFTKVLRQMDRRTRAWKDELPRLFITEYYRTVLRAIESQKYAAQYTPLSDKYARWKAEHGLSPKFWQKTGALRNELKLRSWKAIPVWQGGDSIMFVASLPDTMNWYVELNEWGYRGRGKGGAPMTIPARQLFSVTLDDMRERFEKYTGRALADLATVWGQK